MKPYLALTLIVLILLASCSNELAPPSREVAPRGDSGFKDNLEKLPLHFIANQGQMVDEVGYYLPAGDRTLYFTATGITFACQSKPKADAGSDVDGESSRYALKLDFVDANPEVQLQGEDKQEAVFSYFQGRPADWRAGVPTFARLVYRDLWPGIDLVYSCAVGRLKYDFFVQPGANPDQIRLRYRGVNNLVITETGELEITTTLDSFQDGKPIAYQTIAGQRVEVPLSYDLDREAEGPGRAYGFDVGAYDLDEPLILDPVYILYCGYIGGTVMEEIFGIAVSENGSAYVTGRTSSNELSFPAAVGPDTTYNGGGWVNGDAFVARVSDDGSRLVYCGYIGGTGGETGYDITLDAEGNAYITGYTSSSQASFPVTVGPYLQYSGDTDAFVAKVSADGTQLLYCGYIGGSDIDMARSIALDHDDNAYVIGATGSDETTFPVVVGPDLTYNDSSAWFEADVFVAKVSADGTQLIYCGYIGGISAEDGYGIAVDAAGSAYVTGLTYSPEWSFPVVIGPDLTQNSPPGPMLADAFVAKVVPEGTMLAYCGYIGGEEADYGRSVAVDRSGQAVVVGITESDESTFPVQGVLDTTYNGGGDGFVAGVYSTGTALIYCNYIGGNQSDTALDVVLDYYGFIYLGGSTESGESSFPVIDGPDLTYNGMSDGYVAKLRPFASTFIFCGYVGGSANDCINAVTVDRFFNMYLGGPAFSVPPSFPVLVGPDLTPNGDWDSFVARLSPGDLSGLPDTDQVAATRLLPNVPNPFNPSTQISFELADPGHVRLAIYDLRGRLVRMLVDEFRPAGRHTADWDGCDTEGRPQASGTYLYCLDGGGGALEKKMLLVR